MGDLLMINLSSPVKIELVLEDKTINIKEKMKYGDISLALNKTNKGIDIFLKGQQTPIKNIYLYYEIDIKEDDLIYGDTLERGYANLSWCQKQDRLFFWYFFVNNTKNKNLYSCGAKVHPHSIVLFNINKGQLRIDLNISNGANGVILDNRKLLVAQLIEDEVSYNNLLDACRIFCTQMMEGVNKLDLKEKVLGFNNWYYAYGKSSYKQIIDDTKLLKEVTKTMQITPFMVIDDCWSINSCSGPWYPNEDFKDMAKLANEIKEIGARPGIWFRPLSDSSQNLKKYRHPLNNQVLDFTYPEVKQHVKEVIQRIVDWGYELIKYDYVTWDIFQLFAFQMDENLCSQPHWNFQDRHFTNAEIILDLYETIYKASNGVLLIGCNAIPHLVAGFVQINRIGDDTSGNKWDRTKRYGVNTLAFRLMQDKIFYEADADCVGIMGEEIPWKQNREWLKLLSYSNTPLFVSCNPYLVTEEMKKDLSKAFLINEKENHCEPISWLNELCPTRWNINGKEERFDWNKS